MPRDGMTGRTYLERGRPVVVLKRWSVTHPSRLLAGRHRRTVLAWLPGR